MRPFYLTLLAFAMQQYLHSSHVVSQEEYSAQEEAAQSSEREVARGEDFIVYAYDQTELQDYLIGSSKRND